MKQTLTGLGMALLLSVPTAYAGDCSVSFDQSCLASSYNRAKVERDLERKEARANAEIKAQEDKAEKEAMKARNEERDYRRAQREDSEERVQAYREGRAERVQTFKERVEAIQGKYQEPAPSFLDRRPLKVR